MGTVIPETKPLQRPSAHARQTATASVTHGWRSKTTSSSMLTSRSIFTCTSPCGARQATSALARHWEAGPHLVQGPEHVRMRGEVKDRENRAGPFSAVHE